MNDHGKCLVIGGRANTTPSEGDLSICMTCGNLLRFDSELKTRKLTKSHIEEYPLPMLIVTMKGCMRVKVNIGEAEIPEGA